MLKARVACIRYCCTAGLICDANARFDFIISADNARINFSALAVNCIDSCIAIGNALIASSVPIANDCIDSFISFTNAHVETCISVANDCIVISALIVYACIDSFVYIVTTCINVCIIAKPASIEASLSTTPAPAEANLLL